MMLRSTSHQMLTNELSLLMTIIMIMAVIIIIIIIIHSRNHCVFVEYISEIWKSQTSSL